MEFNSTNNYNNKILETFPQIGWINHASPITELSLLSNKLNSKWIGCKRDDLIRSLHGGTKVRKLDFILANNLFTQSNNWTSVGAIGSGHLATCAVAAHSLNKNFSPHIFWKPVSEGVITNLSYTAAHSKKIYYYNSRTRLVVLKPGIFFTDILNDCAIIQPGASCSYGMLGIINAAFELAQQIQSGESVFPARIYVPLGTGGLAAGLSVGLAMAGIKTEIHAVAVVEKMLSSQWRLNSLKSALQNMLIKNKVISKAIQPLPVYINYKFIGKGYAHVTHESLSAVHLFKEEDVFLEPVYSGKAAAAMLHDIKNGYKEPTLFWVSVRKPLPILSEELWKDKLPYALKKQLERESIITNGISRRNLLFALLGTGIVASGIIINRSTGYPNSNCHYKILSSTEAYILKQSFTVILPSSIIENEELLNKIVMNIDAYLYTLPENLQADIHMMLTAIEQITFLGFNLNRFSDLNNEAKNEYLIKLNTMGGLLRQAYKGLRDICFLGYYQMNQSWHELQYNGPIVQDGFRAPDNKYGNLIAKENAYPKSKI